MVNLLYWRLIPALMVALPVGDMLVAVEDWSLPDGAAIMGGLGLRMFISHEG